MKKQINSLFLICLFGILFSFTQNILNSFTDEKDNFAIELAEEQDDDSRESKENKEKSETEIDDFFSHDFHFSISLYFTNIYLSDYSIGNYTNNAIDLSTPPPKAV